MNAAIAETVYMSPNAFVPVLTKALASVTVDKKLIEKIADGLSEMDKNAEVQKDKRGKVIYDKDTKDSEIVPFEESIDDYMAREVWPYLPDAVAFFEENLSSKKPVIKTGAEIPFTRTFYKYQKLESSKDLERQFMEIESFVDAHVKVLFGCNESDE